MIFAGITTPPPEPVAEAPEEAPLPVVITEPKPKRARTSGGRFQADDPATPERNEAFEEG